MESITLGKGWHEFEGKELAKELAELLPVHISGLDYSEWNRVTVDTLRDDTHDFVSIRFYVNDTKYFAALTSDTIELIDNVLASINKRDYNPDYWASLSWTCTPIPEGAWEQQ